MGELSRAIKSAPTPGMIQDSSSASSARIPRPALTTLAKCEGSDVGGTSAQDRDMAAGSGAFAISILPTWSALPSHHIN